MNFARAIHLDTHDRIATPAPANERVRLRSPPRKPGTAGRIDADGSAFGSLVRCLWVLTAVSLADTPAAADPARAERGAFDGAKIACTQDRGQATTRCEAAVTRGVAGMATVVVTFPNGFARTLFFEDGAFTRGNPTMSGTGRDSDWRVEHGIHLIRVDDQQYEVPDDLLRAGIDGTRP